MIFAVGAASAQRELNPLNTHSSRFRHPVRHGRHGETRLKIRRLGYCDERQNRRTDYLNVGYVFQTSFDQAFNDGPPLTANTKKGFGASVVYGTSYVLHRRPVLGRLHFGIDATWVDVNYSHGKLIRGTARTQQLDLGVGVGPAVHIRAARDLTVDVHFRYNPTFSTFYDEARPGEEVRMGYASMWTGGAAASWRRFSLGGEVRFGCGRYRMVDFAGRDRTPWTAATMPPDPMGPGGPISGDLHNRFLYLRTIGARVYVGFKF